MSAPYCRVYWSIIDDRKFRDVYDNDHHLATWLRLLIAADQAWPASASVPMTARRSSVATLVGVGLIDLQPGGRYRIHGLDAERDRRQSHAQNASNARWNARSNAHAFGHEMPRRDEHRRDETSIGAGTQPDDGRLDLEAFLIVRHRAPTPRQREFLDAYQSVFDATGPSRAERIILGHPDDPIGALKADLDAFRAERRAAADAAEPVARNGRAVEATLRLNHEHGWHAQAAVARCPLCVEVPV